jgi:hypothetical protein
VAPLWSCIGSKIESRWKDVPLQPGQAGSLSLSMSESCEPQSTQKNVPEPGTDPVSKPSGAAEGRTLVKIVLSSRLL